MPVTPTYPGVYIEEIPSGVRTLTGVATSVTAFVGRALRGPVDEATVIFSYADFERQFGGLWGDSDMSYAVRDFYLNGGGQAVIVRVFNGAAPTGIATIDAPKADPMAPPVTFQASNPGSWARSLQLTIDHGASSEMPAAGEFFNLTVTDRDGGAEETFLNVTVEAGYANHPGYLPVLLENRSNLLRLPIPLDGMSNPDPGALGRPEPGVYNDAAVQNAGDGGALDYATLSGDAANKTGMYALEDTDIFNLMCIPNILAYPSLLDDATAYCLERRAMLLIDPDSGWQNPAQVLTGIASLSPSTNTAIYFPRLVQADPLRGGMLVERPPCGAIAGVIARTDAQRGLWKAPAGLEATLRGVPQLSVDLTDDEIGLLNPQGVNCLKNKPPAGRIVWGTRTTVGADLLSSEWKYVPIRRLALYIEESLYRGTQWVVFEPNDEPLWAQIRLNVGAFMNGLFRKGAFQGSAPADAYFVKCDKETTTQADINLGIVNIVVGFAPLKPAEFVIIKLQQMAGQLAA